MVDWWFDWSTAPETQTSDVAHLAHHRPNESGESRILRTGGRCVFFFKAEDVVFGAHVLMGGPIGVDYS